MKNFIKKIYDIYIKLDYFDFLFVILIFVWLLINSNLYWINEKLKELIKIEKQIIELEKTLTPKN